MNRESSPPVAVVVPAYNEERYLADCIASLRDQEYPADRITIVVVDNGSEDGTLEVAGRHGVEAILAPGIRVGEVRNRGVAGTDSDVVAFIDADCIAGPRWISSAVDCLLGREDIGAVGGIYLAPPEGNWLERAWEPRSAGERTESGVLTGGSFIMLRSVFDRFGGFDGKLSAGEDDEFSRRMRAAGMRLLLLDDCAVIHQGWPKTLWQVCRRQYWQGSNQIEAAKSPLNLGLLFVHLHLAGLLGLLVSMFVPAWWPKVPLVSALAVAVTVGVGAAKKWRAASGRTPLKYLQLVVMFGAHYAGRCAGLIVNYGSLVSRRSIRTYK